VAFAHVQSAKNTASTGVTTTTGIGATGSAIGTGNTVAGTVSWSNLGAPATNVLNTITDNKGNTYPVVDTGGDPNATQVSCSSFLLGNVIGGPTTITATFSGSNPGAATIIWDEYSGALTNVNPTDVHTKNAQHDPGTGSNAITSGNITTTIPGDLIYGAVCETTNGSTAIAAGSSYTLRVSNEANAGLNSASSEDQVQTSAGSIAATFTDGTNGATDDTITFAIAIKPSNGIGAPISIGTPTNISGGTASSYTFTTNANIVAGDLVVLSIMIDDLTTAANVSTVSDGTNTYSRAVQRQDATNAVDIEIWYKSGAAAVSSGATITVTLSAATAGAAVGIQGFRITGIASTGALDKTNSAQGLGGTTPSYSTGTLAKANEIIIAATNTTSTTLTNYNPGAGFTNAISTNIGPNNFEMTLDYDIVDTTTAVTYAPTWTGSSGWWSDLATFVAPSAAAAPVSTLAMMGVG